MNPRLWITVLLSIVVSVCSYAEGKEPQPIKSMDNDKLEALVKRFDSQAKGRPGFWEMTYEDVSAYVITDEKANRMRIILEVADANQLEKDHLYRLMQANFDSALDARYAIAQNSDWSTFIHPLGSLSEFDFFSGLAQVITLVKTFVTSFSSGAIMFNGGDSREEQQKLYQQLLKKGLSV